MKILMLGWELPPHNSGGLGVACHEIAKNLALDGVSIDFVLPYTADHGIEEYSVHGTPGVTPAKIFTGGGAYDSRHFECSDEACAHEEDTTSLRGLQHRYTKYVERLVSQGSDADIIHAHDWLTFEAGMRAKQISGKPLVAHVHATEFDRSGEHQGNPVVHDIEYSGLTMADRIIAVSKVTKDLIVKNYQIPPEKIEVVHNAINTHDFSSSRGSAQTYQYLELMKQRGYKVVVSLGRLTVQKGLRYFLEAAAQASRIDDKMLFLIAGNGEQRDELIEYAAALGIADKVLFAGFVRGQQLRDAYSIGDMFVMSSVSEPFGLTALEAAGNGNAIILTKQSGVGEVLHNVLRYNYWDTTTLANQMAMTSLYPTLQNELSKNVLYEFQHFSWAKVSRQCTDIYKKHMPLMEAVV
jgi:glycogen synthase